MIQKIYTDRKINRLGGSSIYKKLYKGSGLIFEYADVSQLSVSDSTIKFAKTGETKTFTIYSNDTWQISSIPAWATLSQTTGVGTTNITITAESTTETRENNIVVSTVSKNVQITLKQELVYYVSEIYCSEHTNVCPIEIPINSSNTLKFRVKGKLLYGSGNIVVGSTMESSAYRFFFPWEPFTNNKYLDMGNGRLTGTATALGTEIDYTIGNFYVYDNVAHTYPLQGSTRSDCPSAAMKWYVNYLSCMEWQLWEGDTLVFNGKAAVEDGQGGIYDEISGNFYTNNDYQISFNE